MKVVKVLLIILASGAVGFAAFWHFYFKEQVAFARVATAYGAKMVCSCRFVANREMESCRGDFTADISAISFSVDREIIMTKDDATITKASVTASVLGGLIKNTARFEPGLGCTLVKP